MDKVWRDVCFFVSGMENKKRGSVRAGRSISTRTNPAVVSATARLQQAFDAYYL